jgi:ABC-type Fe3+-hydroxamate transport system substrate-binding protein
MSPSPLEYFDDLGAPVHLTLAAGSGHPLRIVSLVPSLTEAIARSAPGTLVGATDWCTHPAELDVVRIGGTKNPNVQAIGELAPDLVIANAEENRAHDLDELRSLGLSVWVTDIRTVDGALTSMHRLLSALGAADLTWLDAARIEWDSAPAVIAGTQLRAVIPIWRRPWMHVGRDTYAGDVLRRLGVENALADSPERYPKMAVADLPSVDLVVLPDEPYLFTGQDGPEAFSPTPCALVSGRLLTWYGPAMLGASGELITALRAGMEEPPLP